MLKCQLSEQNNVLKNIFEERVSYRTALQSMTKRKLILIRRKLFHHNLSLLTMTMDNAVGQFNKILGTTEETRGALTRLQSRHQSQKIHMLVPITTTSMQENQ